MRPKWYVLLLSLMSVSAHAQFPIEIIEYIEDTKVVAFIDEAELDDSMQWRPLKEAPPFTIANVVDAITKYIASMDDVNEPLIIEIELKTLPNHEKYWHYLVKLKAKRNNDFNDYYFVVLMNGKIIPAVKEYGSIK